MRLKVAMRVNVCALLLFANLFSYSHDIWLFPDQFILSKGDTLVVHQFLGSEFAIDMELELLLDMTPAFHLITPDSTIDLLGEIPGRFQFVSPVLTRKLNFEGLGLLTMEHDFIYDEFSREKFFEYLEHEGLSTKKYRKLVGKDSTQTERYGRTLKCLIQVGEGANGEQYKQILGQKLEIVLMQNPYRLDPGDDLEIQVLFEGKPLRHHWVEALNGDGKKLCSKLRVRTNNRGTAYFKMDKSGFWLIRLVHLFPCSDEYTAWESYWASYSFELD